MRLCEVTWRDSGFDEEGQFVPQHLRAPDVALFRGKESLSSEALRQSPPSENEITLLLHSSSLFLVSYSIEWKSRLRTRFLYLVTFPIHFSISELLFSVQAVFWCGSRTIVMSLSVTGKQTTSSNSGERSLSSGWPTAGVVVAISATSPLRFPLQSWSPLWWQWYPQLCHHYDRDDRWNGRVQTRIQIIHLSEHSSLQSKFDSVIWILHTSYILLLPFYIYKCSYDLISRCIYSSK